MRTLPAIAAFRWSFVAVAAGTLSLDYRLELRGARRMKNEIKVDLGERSLQSALHEFAGIAFANHLRDEPVTGRKSEVIVEQRMRGVSRWLPAPPLTRGRAPSRTCPPWPARRDPLSGPRPMLVI